MNPLQSYRLRLRRRRLELRARRKRRELSSLQDNTNTIHSGDVLLFATVFNEAIRLPYFLEYYRNLGVSHFLIVDNGSSDGSVEWLQNQSDVSIWQTEASYKRSRFGVDWITALQSKYGVGHWCLVVDVDEFLVYPYCDTRPLPALTDWLDASGVRAFGTLLLDMYPKGKVVDAVYSAGQNPIEICEWFDAGNYTYEQNHLFGNLWIQGGVRSRVFFSETPKSAPALNKVPLVKWRKGYVYESSTHMLLPRGLNLVYDTVGGEKTSGALLRTKFMNDLGNKLNNETVRKQHYANGVEYRHYVEELENSPELWNRWSEKYINWRQLEIMGLMSKGNWA